MSPGMTLPQSGLIETVDFGDAPFQVQAVALAALISILLVGGAVADQPGIRMLTDAAQRRGLIIGLAATKEGATGCCRDENFGP